MKTLKLLALLLCIIIASLTLFSCNSAAPSIEINDDGCWVINGVLTDVKAEGIDGKNGADGLDGKDGADGKDGINGVNGADGKDGLNGKDGVDGKDGSTPVITIGENGNWFVDGVDTGVKAQGEQG